MDRSKLIGIDASIIPKEVIPFDGELVDRTVIENQLDKALIYYKSFDGYVLMTDDPCNNYLTEEDLHSLWINPKDQGLNWCIKKALESTKK
jgi:hypothetical protein